MRSHFQLIGYHLRSLTRFSGRDARPTFWPWAITLLVAATAAMNVLMVPVMIGMTALAGQQPDRSRIDVGPGSYAVQIESGMPGLAAIMTPMAIGVAVIAAIIIPLVAASVTRRLHDHGKSGAWGLLPLPFLAAGLFLVPQIFGAAVGDGLFVAGLINNFVYLAMLLYLVVLLIRDGDPGANRYGPPPS